MLASHSLQPPKSGRSRYSKALPAVPGLASDNSLPSLPLESPRKDLPPPPRSDTAGRSHETPLSAITSPTSSVGTPTSIKSKMTIPRRPVGGGAKTPGLPATPSPRPAAAPAPAPAKLPNPPPPPTTTDHSAAAIPPPSPSDSLSDSFSSLLSAYSRSSIGSPVMSSEGTASFRDSQQASSTQSDKSPGVTTAILTASSTPLTPVTFTPVPPPKETSITNKTTQQAWNPLPKPAISPVPVETSPPPPPPAKDLTPTQQTPLPAPPPQTAEADLSAASPTRPQLWRRRSINKSKDLPPLTIHSSHGSTASTTPAPPPKQEAETSSILTQSTTETIKPLPPLSSKPLPTVGLPGRNVRPVPTKSQEKEATEGMGTGTSRLRRLSDKIHRTRNSSESASLTKPEPIARSTAGRPPTPEYQKQDVKTPMLDTFVSPASPASSPEPGKQAPPPVSKDPSPSFTKGTHTQLPKIDTASISRKAVAPAPTPDLQTTRSVPDLRSATPSPPTAPLPSLPSAASSIAASRGRRPSDATSMRGRDSSDTSRFQPRGSSVKPEGRQKLVSSQSVPHNVSPDHDPRLVRSNSGNMLYRGRDGTLYPEMKEAGEPDAQASYFPTHPQGRIPEGTILTAPPLRNTHFLCYQKHRSMGRRINRQYPLTCQTCDKADVEDRWVCTFCQLRVCAPCLEKLNTKGRDLKQLVDSMKTPEIPDVMSLSSTERSGSALGLQINF